MWWSTRTKASSVPVSPEIAEDLARSVVEAYTRAEATLLALIARNLADGRDAPDWAERKLAQIRSYRAQVERLLHELEAEAQSGVATAMTDAYHHGGLAAADELERMMRSASVEPLGATRAIDALARETLGCVIATHPRILRATMDAYQQVIAETLSQEAAQSALRQITAEEAGQVLSGVQTRRQASQAALDRLARKGITGFVDRAGRHWAMDSYVEMAMRTGVSNAARQGHVDRLTGNGFDLVIVSDAPHECPVCSIWEGKVLSLSGASPYPTLADARAAGLFHPGCRHSISAYQPGITPPMTGTEDSKAYEAVQKQRYLERQIRASKRMAAAAMDPAAARKAKARTLAYQAKLREHVERYDLKRLRYREQA